MILMIDNYDSFTYNLVQYLAGCGREVHTIRNDALDVNGIFALRPELIVISPGPGRPEDAGICVELIQKLPDDLPLFGVCLGFQAMAHAFGGKIVHAPYLMHGKTSRVTHDGRGLFRGLPTEFSATRYHSLIAEESSLPDCFQVSARTDDGLVMGIRHRTRKMEGVQFHPESYMTQCGHEMIHNLFETKLAASVS